MTMEDVIKQETERFINNYKQKLKENGYIIDPLNETMLRTGISQGIAIAGLALVNVPANITSS